MEHMNIFLNWEEYVVQGWCLQGIPIHMVSQVVLLMSLVDVEAGEDFRLLVFMVSQHGNGSSYGGGFGGDIRDPIGSPYGGGMLTIFAKKITTSGSINSVGGDRTML